MRDRSLLHRLALTWGGLVVGSAGTLLAVRLLAPERLVVASAAISLVALVAGALGTRRAFLAARDHLITVRELRDSLRHHRTR
ncbi:MAG TPA: hypothetical protein VFQ22_13960 [Longimicrobiales bacterium]|nr:hypothetical protein [Longimicrobiales bacterium]